MAGKYSEKIIGKHPDEITLRFKTNEGVKQPTYVTHYIPKKYDLRYGNNPGETAALYGKDTLLTTMKELKTGKSGPSQTNIEDICYSLATVGYFSDPAVVVMKHENACGFAKREDGDGTSELYRRARDYDFRSSFGGVVGMNAPLDMETAGEITRTFMECVAAPEFEEGTLDILNSVKSKSKSLRAFKYDMEKLKAIPRFVGDKFEPLAKQLPSGEIVRADPHLTAIKTPQDLLQYVVTHKKPTERELKDLQTALFVDIHLRSNSCVFVKNGYVVGVGTGTFSRVDAFEMGIGDNRKLEELAKTDEWKNTSVREHTDYSIIGSVVATDAFAPFEDAPLAAYAVGVRAMIFIQGGERFKEIVRKMDALGDVSYIALPPEERHFRH